MDVYNKVTTHEFKPTQETLRQNFYESFPTDLSKSYGPYLTQSTIAAILSDVFTRNFRFVTEPDYNIKQITMTVSKQKTVFEHKKTYQFSINISAICDNDKSVSCTVDTPVFICKCDNIKTHIWKLDEKCRNAAFDMQKEIETLENPNLSDLETNKEDNEEELD